MQKYYFSLVFLFIIKIHFTCSRDSNSKYLFTKLNQRYPKKSTIEIGANSENDNSSDIEERTYHSNYLNEAPQTFVDILNTDPIIISIERVNNRDTKI